MCPFSKATTETLPYAGESALKGAAAGVKVVHLPCEGLQWPTVHHRLWAIAAFEMAINLESNCCKGQVKVKMAALKTARTL